MTLSYPSLLLQVVHHDYSVHHQKDATEKPGKNHYTLSIYDLHFKGHDYIGTYAKLLLQLPGR